MDEPSRSVVVFLQSLQDATRQLGTVWGHYHRRGTQPGRPFLVLGSRPFSVYEGGAVQRFSGSIALGLPVKGPDGREYELTVDVLWDAERWTIMTIASVEADAGGQCILRQLPERTAVDLRACTEQLTAAVGDLIGFEDLIPGKGG